MNFLFLYFHDQRHFSEKMKKILSRKKMKKMEDVAINADHKVFFLMITFNVIMLVSSIIQMILGKGRRITPAKPAKDAKLHLDNQSS